MAKFVVSIVVRNVANINVEADPEKGPLKFEGNVVHVYDQEKLLVSVPLTDLLNSGMAKEAPSIIAPGQPS